MSGFRDSEEAARFLGAERVEKEVLEVITENIDQAMVDGWGELWQREDVVEWIRNPKEIQKIQPSLTDFANLLRIRERPVTVLDAGCYGGYVYDYLDRYVFDDPRAFAYTGIDSQAAVVEAAKLLHGGRDNAEFEVADVYELETKYPGRRFDVVFCSRVLVQIPWFQRALSNLFAVTGKVLFTVIAVKDRPRLERIRRTNIDTGEDEIVYFRYFTVSELAAAAAELDADYRVVQGPGPYSSYVLYRET